MRDEITQQWSYGTKLNSCSKDKWHEEGCNGICEQLTATKGQVDLHNEVAIWAAKGIPIVGKPAVIADQIRVPGFHVEILSTDKRLESLLGFLVEKNLLDEEEYLEYHRAHFAEFLKTAREQSEKEQAKASIVIPHIGLGKIPGDGKLH